MNVDKFGSNIFLREKNSDVKLAECILKCTTNGNIDLQTKILTNAGSPNDPNDCATKYYVDEAVATCRKVLKTLDKIIADVIDKINKLEKHNSEIVKLNKKK